MTQQLQNASTEELQKLALVRGVIHEFHTCQDAGRVWTGNWDSNMIGRLQRTMGMEHFSKKQCRRLRKILHDIYEIIAQGVNDIQDVRNGVREILETKREMVSEAKQHTGQQNITDWLIDSAGLNGRQRREQEALTTRMEDAMDDCSSLPSDDLAQFDWADYTMEGVPDNWIPEISEADASHIHLSLIHI